MIDSMVLLFICLFVVDAVVLAAMIMSESGAQSNGQPVASVSHLLSHVHLVYVTTNELTLIPGDNIVTQRIIDISHITHNGAEDTHYDPTTDKHRRCFGTITVWVVNK